MATWVHLLDWRRMLVYTHRWLGALFCVLFIAWFASGMVMMYARMPVLESEERLARAEPLDLSTLAVSPSEAVATMGATARPSRLVLGMSRGRPVYRASSGGARGAATVVFADTGEMAPAVTRDQAADIARRFVPGYRGAVTDDGWLTGPDQWTLQARAQLPMYRFALTDAEGTRLYVSQRTGDVVLRTTSRERFWAYLGPVLHWLYFTPLRSNGSLWSEVIIWTSVTGCVVCLSGIIWVWSATRHQRGSASKGLASDRRTPA